MAKAKTARRTRAHEERSLREERGASEDSDDEEDEEDEEENEEQQERDTRPRATPRRRLRAFVALELMRARVLENPWTFVRETLELVVAVAVLALVARSLYKAHEEVILDVLAPAVRLSQRVDELVERHANATHRFARLERHRVVQSFQRPR